MHYRSPRNRKSLYVGRNSKGVITVEVTRSFTADGHISVTESGARKAFNEVLPKVKRWHNLICADMGYSAVDVRDSDCDFHLTTQYASWTKGSGKVKADVEERETYYLPKAWDKYFTIKLDNPKTISYVKKFANIFGIELTSGQEAKLRKTLKGGPSFTWDNFND